MEGIASLKESLVSQIDVTGRRIGFAKILTVIFGATTGVAVSGEMLMGAAVVGTATVEVGAVAGAIALGGLSFPPIGAILLGAAVGTVCVGSLTLFIIRCWKRRQSKALGYLNELLGYMNKLSSANESFAEYMRRAEADAGAVLANIETIKSNVRSGSQRYRAASADICLNAIQSTNEVIQCINEVCRISASELVVVQPQGSIDQVEFFKETDSGDDESSSSIKSSSKVR
jgi:hypothetical protein